MSDAYRIVAYSPRFRSQVLKLQRHLWGNSIALNSEYFAWKYESNPYIKDPILYLVLFRGELVAMRGVFGSRWRSNGDTRVIPCLADSVVAPEHRGRGLIGMINRHALKHLSSKGYSHVFGLSANDIIYQAFRGLGARDVGGLKVLTLDLEHNIRAPGGRPVHPVMVSRHPRSDAMARFNDNNQNAQGLGHVRDGEYYAWRFRNPMCRYHFCYRGNSTLHGYLVIQTSVKTGHRRGNIVDWAVDEDHLFADLLDAAIESNITQKLRVWSSTLTGNEVRFLQDRGFREIKRPGSGAVPTIQYRPTEKELVSEDQWRLGDCLLTDKDNWALRMIYSDST